MVKYLMLIWIGFASFAFGADSQTVSDVLKNAQNKDTVVLVGRLTTQLDNDEFIFTDRTGSIKVTFDSKDFDLSTLPSMNTPMQIKATVNKENSPKTELDITKFEIVEKPQS